jgi:hypothetical protein
MKGHADELCQFVPNHDAPVRCRRAEARQDALRAAAAPRHAFC